MNKCDNIKIVIGDIIRGQAGICIPFIVLCNNQDKNEFIGYIKYIDINIDTYKSRWGKNKIRKQN